MSRSPASPRALLLILGLLLAILFVALGHLPLPLEAHPAAYVPLYLAAFALYFSATRVADRSEPTRDLLAMLYIGAVLFRLIVLFQSPSLSTDVWRYVWDGHVTQAGLNPYRYAPADPATAPYRTAYWHILNHPTWVTMYPPLSQRLFGALAWFGASSPFAFKAVFAACDLGCVALLALLLRRAGLPLSRLIRYAWHPLVIVEISGSGHQDVLGILFMLAAAIALGRGERVGHAAAGGAAAGLSMMAKGYLLPALPIFARKRPIAFGLALALVIAALLAPFLGHGSRMLPAMNRYLHNRLRNAGVYGWIFQRLRGLGRAADRVTRMVTTAILGGIVLALAWRPWKDESDLLRRSTTAMGAFFLLSNTVYPWYATWLVPGLCFGEDGTAASDPMAGWLLWSGLVPLAYLNPLPGVNDWVPDVEYLPVLALFAWQVWACLRRARTAARAGGNPA